MLIFTHKLLSALETAKAIKEHKDLYCLDPKRIPVSIVDVEWVIQDRTGFRFSKIEITTSSDVVHVRGILERYAQKEARILIRSNQPDDWKRFVTVKELCHVAIDAEEDLTPNGDQTIERMIVEESQGQFAPKGDNGDGVQVAPIEVQSEYIAEIVAREILYPFEFRDHDLSELAEGKTTAAALALHFKIPEVMIERALFPGHHQMMTRFWTTGKI